VAAARRTRAGSAARAHSALLLMTIDTLRVICESLPGVTEDVKWGSDLCFSVGQKMFVVVNLDPPHQVSFKCTPEAFGELVERPGIIPAPYMARNMWVQEQALGDTLTRAEFEELVRTSYEMVVAKLPKSKRPGSTRSTRSTTATTKRSGGAKAKRTGTARRRRRT
jgi:predicted DNA-binding protein (MmcQ/YjbR family)